MDCGYITTPQNGSKFGGEITYPHFIEFSCDEGFIMLGSKTRNCLANGTWSGQRTICKGEIFEGCICLNDELFVTRCG